MIPKAISDIGIADLEALIGVVRESKTIEFKREMPGRSDDTPFLAGVSSLANTLGGDFIIGVSTSKDGLVDAVPGISCGNPDLEKLRLEQLLATNIEPRLPRADIRLVSKGVERFIIVIRLARSWIGPHRVRKNDKFYGRNSAGKYPLDVTELRTAFVLADSSAERIRSFRAERLLKIMSGETPLTAADAVIVLHVVPLPSFADRRLIDVVPKIASGYVVPLPLDGPSGSNRDTVNLDGYLNCTHVFDGGISSYVQLFRSGALEGVSRLKKDSGGPYIHGAAFANKIVAAVEQYLKFLKSIEVGLPVFVFVSLCGIDGCRFRHGSQELGGAFYETGPLRGDLIAFPEVAIEGDEVEVPIVMRPIFNIVWNAFGIARSDMYSDRGCWKGQK